MARQPHLDDELRKQLGGILGRAREALGELRDVVVRSSQIGKIKIDATFLRRERDAVLQQLGAAVFHRVEAGELALPADLEEMVAALRSYDEKLHEHDAELEAVESEAALQREAARAAAAQAREVEADLADDKYAAFGAESPEAAQEADAAKKSTG